MNATNLGTQPEHRKLFCQDNLHEAAWNYAKSVADLRGGIQSGVPFSFTNQLTRNVLEAKSNLEEAAIQYFDTVYDGGDE